LSLSELEMLLDWKHIVLLLLLCAARVRITGLAVGLHALEEAFLTSCKRYRMSRRVLRVIEKPAQCGGEVQLPTVFASACPPARRGPPNGSAAPDPRFPTRPDRR